MQAEPEFFLTTEPWRVAYPGAHAGVLVVRGAANPAHSPQLQERKQQLENELLTRFAGQDRAALRENPTLLAYARYYRRFDKTYHVQLQIESIVFKNKPIPMGAALVEAMFIAEIDSMLLTAGHDLDVVQPPLRLELARGTESYVLLRGTPQAPKTGDMMISDTQGIISTIVYGPDQRTQITAQTRNAVFTVYAPPGIGADRIEAHLREIARNVQLIVPTSHVSLLQVISAT